jgi:hypothetical protein
MAAFRIPRLLWPVATILVPLVTGTPDCHSRHNWKMSSCEFGKGEAIFTLTRLARSSEAASARYKTSRRSVGVVSRTMSAVG